MTKKETFPLRTLVFRNGVTYRITGETDRYYLCGNTQFRKSNPNILEVKEYKQPKPKKENKENQAEEKEG